MSEKISKDQDNVVDEQNRTHMIERIAYNIYMIESNHPIPKNAYYS